MVFTEREGDANGVAIQQAFEWEHVGNLAIGDQLDRLALVEAQTGKPLAEAHIGIISVIDGAGRNEGAAQTGWDTIEAFDAYDFLNEVDVALEVGAERRHVPSSVGQLSET
jgi:hypothetical protein